MKNTTPALLSMFASMRNSADAVLYMTELYTIWLRSGTVLTISGADIPVTWNGLVYSASSVQLSGMKYRSQIGLSADSQQIIVSARSTDLIGGVPALQAIQQGVLDGAQIQRERVFLSSWNSPPIGSVILFKGRVTSIDSVGRVTATITVASDLVLLDLDMPRNLFQPTCANTLFDAGCGILKTGFTVTGAVTGISDMSTIQWSSSTTDYSQGTVLWTSGANSGVTKTIKTSNATSFQLVNHLPVAPAVGDTFTITKGCDHTMTTCRGRFNNIQNFRGFPYVPPRSVVTGFV